MRKGGAFADEIHLSFRGYRNSEHLLKWRVPVDYTIGSSEWEELLNRIGYRDNREFRIELEAEFKS